MPSRLLFVCSQNKWRSLTAERLFDDHPHYEARSAGTEPGARVRVTAGHIGWADIVFVMEKRHTDRLREKYAAELGTNLSSTCAFLIITPSRTLN